MRKQEDRISYSCRLPAPDLNLLTQAFPYLLPRDLPIIKVHLLLPDDLVIFMALAGKHNHITRPRQSDGNGHGFMPVRNNIVWFFSVSALLCTLLQLLS